MTSEKRPSVESVVASWEDELRDMLSAAAEAIVITDATGRIVFANQSTARLFRYPPEDMPGLSVDELVPAPLPEIDTGDRWEQLGPSTPRSMGDERKLAGRRRDGTEFPIEVVLRPMVRDSGTLVAYFITDVTKRQESEDRIRSYQERLQRMAFDATVAEERERRRIAVDLHDRIGQALALAQIKLTDVLETLSGPPRRAVLEAIELLAQSVIDTRTLTFELSPPILYDLGLKEALSWLVEDVEKRGGVHIELQADDVPKPLEDAMAAVVFRSVRELLLNVVKHARSPTAMVALRQRGDQLDIEVADHGVGFRLDDAASHAASGFGLFSIREQIGRLGGTLSVATAPGQGTRVSLRVPLRLKAD